MMIVPECLILVRWVRNKVEKKSKHPDVFIVKLMVRAKLSIEDNNWR